MGGLESHQLNLKVLNQIRQSRIKSDSPESNHAVNWGIDRLYDIVMASWMYTHILATAEQIDMCG